jgi:hypothetical protein
MNDKKFRPTMALRWAEMEEENKTIPATITREYVTYHFKLQQYWIAEDGTGRWQDISVEHVPLSNDKPTNPYE